MIKLITFDIDETLLTDKMEHEDQYVRGIIPTAKLLELESLGIKIALVSPSPYGPSIYKNDDHWFRLSESNEYRWKNVIDAQMHYNIQNSETIYVDDLLSNRIQLEKLGIKSYSPEEFMNSFDLIKNSFTL